MASLKAVLAQISDRLKKVNRDRSLFEGRLIVSHILECRPEALIIDDERELSLEDQNRVEALVKRRLQFEPMAYLLGEKEFYGLSFFVDSSVLIPRPESESLVEGVLKWIQARKLSSGRILDLGAGSGCLAISLAKNISDPFEIIALDSSQMALEVARKNQTRHQAKNLKFLQGDILSGPSQTEAFDIIVSNPPYIPSDQMETLQEDIRRFEPKLALDGGERGLKFYEAIFKLWLPCIAHPGLLAIETLGPAQQVEIKAKLNLEGARGIWHDGPHVFVEV
jgi:release factor glutamine methyltransferase